MIMDLYSFNFHKITPQFFQSRKEEEEEFGHVLSTFSLMSVRNE